MQNRFVVAVGLVVATLVAVAPSQAGESEAEAMLDALKALEGTWQGTPEGEGADALPETEKPPQVNHDFSVSAAGTVVMETMNPGTDHEMINMYHLDGDELVLTHYCAGGNQPSLRLVADDSSPEKLVFDFVGGTNLDPEVDEHIHSAQITLEDNDQVVSA
jgi:hypothetical protein